MLEAVNRYANIDLFLPEAVHNRIESFVSRSATDPRPFERQVDLWWAGIALGLQLGTRTPASERGVKFHSGVVFNSDPWRITHLELLALSEEGEEVLDRPNRVIEIASEYANTGLPGIVDLLLGEAEPTLTFLNRLGDNR